MKKLLFTILCLSTLVSCNFEVYQQSFLQKQPIPTYPHPQGVEVYGQSDLILHKEPLILVNSFDFDMHPVASEQDAIDSLKVFSQNMGYDIVKVLGSEIHSWDEAEITALDLLLAVATGDENTGEVVTYTTKRYKINAYTYLENIENLNRLQYSKELFELSEEGTMETVSEHFFKPDGSELTSTGSIHHYTRLYRFSEDYLLHDQKGWEYRWVNDNKMIRQNRLNRVVIHFSGAGTDKLPSDLERTELAMPDLKYHISLFYDDSGKITNKEVLHKGNLYASMRYEFDASGRISKEFIEMHETGKQYQFVYEYYDKARLLNYAEEQDLKYEIPLVETAR